LEDAMEREGLTDKEVNIIPFIMLLGNLTKFYM